MFLLEWILKLNIWFDSISRFKKFLIILSIFPVMGLGLHYIPLNIGKIIFGSVIGIIALFRMVHAVFNCKNDGKRRD